MSIVSSIKLIMGSCSSISAHYVIHYDPLVKEYAGDLLIPILYKGKVKILRIEKGTKYATVLAPTDTFNQFRPDELDGSLTI